MLYAIVIDGVYQGTANAPRTLVTKEGVTIFGFDMLFVDEKIAHGYYPFLDLTPPFDPETHQVLSERADVLSDRVELTKRVAAIDIDVLIKRKIMDIYEKARELIDALSIGYSAAEIAQFPLMQAVINRGRHTAASLSALLTPKINMQNATLESRDNHVAAIMALTTHQEVADYDVMIGWS